MKKTIAVLLSAVIGLTSAAGFAAPANEQQPRPAQTQQAPGAKAQNQSDRKIERKGDRKGERAERQDKRQDARKKGQHQKRHAQNTKNGNKQQLKKNQKPQNQRAAKAEPMRERAQTR
ncbi:MAG: hypothetical protein Q4G28_03415 [Neisseria sp.]|nr:hypothetical protein [Neisseria sp.]